MIYFILFKFYYYIIDLLFFIYLYIVQYFKILHQGLEVEYESTYMHTHECNSFIFKILKMAHVRVHTFIFFYINLYLFIFI